MKRRAFLLGTPAALLLASGAAVRADEGLVVVANASLRALDAESLRRIYTGRMIEVDGQPVFPAQLAPQVPPYPLPFGIRRLSVDLCEALPFRPAVP